MCFDECGIDIQYKCFIFNTGEFAIIKSDPYRDKLEDFEKKVNSYLDDGWKLAGTLIIFPVDTGDKTSLSPQFLQPLIKNI